MIPCSVLKCGLVCFVAMGKGHEKQKLKSMQVNRRKVEANFIQVNKTVYRIHLVGKN